MKTVAGRDTTGDAVSFRLAPAVGRLQAELADREAIRDCLYRYCRGVDRCDEAALASAYWPDATDDHGIPGREPLPALEFVCRVIPRLRRMKQTAHSISNVLIRTSGERAAVESYLHAYHRLAAEGTFRDVFAAGRYLDVMEKRAGEWRILERAVVIDWFREEPDSGDWNKGVFGGPLVMGRRSPDDRSAAFFARRLPTEPG